MFKVTMKTPERRHLLRSDVLLLTLNIYFTPCPNVSMAEFEQVIVSWAIDWFLSPPFLSLCKMFLMFQGQS